MAHYATTPEQLRATWLRGDPPDADQRRTLIVFPHAGGGASFYRSWLESDDFAVRIVQYPGREDRIADTRASSLTELADGVARAVASLGEAPVCLFGHSMGALVAFEVAHRLEAAGRADGLQLCVSSYTAPHLLRHERMQEMDDEAYLDYARTTAGEIGADTAAPSAFEIPELRDLVIAGLRADFAMLGRYRTDREPRLVAPILVLRGADEPIDPTEMDAWAEVTWGSCRSATLPGGHFYLSAQRDALLDKVKQWSADVEGGSHRDHDSADAGVRQADEQPVRDDDIAVIGLAARVPGAADLDEFWANLCAGTESATVFTDDELRSAGMTQTEIDDPRLVRSRPILADVADFDAKFFGYAPSEARLIDPQQRLFLECAWEAVESAGYDLQRYDGAVGVFAGGSGSTYYQADITNSGQLQAAGYLQTTLSTENDFLAPRVSFKLNLGGPSISMGTGCSTALVATHLAVQSLLSGESDMALAGGASITFPQHSGYLATAGGAISLTGKCRAFDEGADGTIIGDGVGVVLLKRAVDAIADHDSILGIIRGSAVNNDGSDKAGFAAPSLRGQAACITEALSVAEVPADTIDYVEAHGTGTPMGDPVEAAALTDAFRSAGDSRTAGCRIGTLKPNIGHTGPATGILGLIKVLLAFKHRTFPPAVNYVAPNPQLDLERSPFYVGRSLRRWEVADGKPRRAAVSAYSMGGTNAHVVLQEPPASPIPEATDEPRLLVLSARTEQALADARKKLAGHLAAHPEHDLAAVAATLRLGRRAFSHRFAAVCTDSSAAQAVLDGVGRAPLRTGVAANKPAPVALLFPGQGSQFSGMGAGLYATSPVYRHHVDECATCFKPLIGTDLRELMLADPADEDATAALRQTRLTQPALFTVGYALTQVLAERGVQPVAMLGHSIGELVAACVAGVFTLPDAVELVALRGEFVQRSEPGTMAAVGASLDAVTALLPAQVSVAAVNAPDQIVVTGTFAGIDEFAERAAQAQIRCTRLSVDHAFHSALLDGAASSLTEAAARIPLRAPQIPFLSNVTGTWISAAQATDPEYWGRQLRATVQFASGLAALRADYPEAVLAEVGPGYTLRGLVSTNAPGTEVVPMLGGASGDSAVLATAALGQLWVAGVELDWPDFGEHRRVPLPTYPFQRERLWLGSSNPVAKRVSDGEAPVAQENSDADRSSGVETSTVDEIWCEALGVPNVEANDNFFDLGGNSLIAAQIVAALTQRCGVEVSVAELWDRGATVADLADLVANRRAEPAAQLQSAADSTGAGDRA